MKYIISGGWSYGNIGDEVIAKSTIELFSKFFKNDTIMYTSYKTSDFLKIHNIEAYPSIHSYLEKNIRSLDDFELIKNNMLDYNLKEYISMFDANTVFVMSGGGYFSENWITQFVSRLLEIYIAHMKGAKVVIIGQSIGPVFSTKGRLLLKEILDLCDYISVRDSSSQNLLKNINPSSIIKLNPDLAVTISDYIIASEPHDFINVMPAAYTSYRYINSKKKNKILEKIKKRFSIVGLKYKKEWKKIITELSNNNRIRFVMSVKWNWDLKFVNYLTNNNKLHNCEIIKCESAEQMCKYLSEGKLVISTKMHPIIVSVSYGVPAIAISYDYKVDDFMNTIKLDDFCFKNDNFNHKIVIEKVNQIQKDIKKIDCIEQKKQVYSMMEEIKELFK